MRTTSSLFVTFLKKGESVEYYYKQFWINDYLPRKREQAFIPTDRSENAVKMYFFLNIAVHCRKESNQL